MANQRRTLFDLYVPGKAVSIDDGKGPVDVWVQKLSKVDQHTATRKAGAAKAVVLAARSDEDSELRQMLWAEVQGYDRDALIAYLTEEDLTKRTISVQARLEHEEGSEWGKDGYLEGLVEAWDDGLKDRFQTDPDDVEAQRVFAELKRFSDAVRAEVAVEAEDLQLEWERATESELHEKVLVQLLESQADDAWAEEYQLCQVWLATRHPDDHSKRYFATRSEVDMVDDRVVDKILATYAEISVGVDQGKGSPAIPASSPASEPPADQAMASSSGHLAATG